jgi:hypothetical protein
MGLPLRTTNPSATADGRTWSLVIDASAVLMTLVSATGLVLIFFLQKHKMAGFLAIAIGALICILAYWVLI